MRIPSFYQNRETEINITTRTSMREASAKQLKSKLLRKSLYPLMALQRLKIGKKQWVVPSQKKWFGTTTKEMKRQLKKNVFRITFAPHGEPIIESQWVFKIKENPDGTITEFKARCVAKEYIQVEGRDYDEAYAPVVRSDTSKMVAGYNRKKKKENTSVWHRHSIPQ